MSTKKAAGIKKDDKTSDRASDRRRKGEARLKIKAALDVIMSKVPCLKFREKTYTDSHYMEFTTGI
eukprot:gene8813-14848_t